MHAEKYILIHCEIRVIGKGLVFQLNNDPKHTASSEKHKIELFQSEPGPQNYWSCLGSFWQPMEQKWRRALNVPQEARRTIPEN